MNGDRLSVYLERMDAAAERAAGYVAAMDKVAFEKDLRTQDAIVANIAAIGECAIKIMDGFPDFVADHPQIPWRDIRAMRNRVAHRYFEVDVETIWLTVKLKMPELRQELAALRNWRAQGE